MTHLDDLATHMKRLGDILLPYNKNLANEDVLSALKSRAAVVDGYEVVIYYTKVQAEKTMEIVQVYGQYNPFVPFATVCKIGKAFLGDRELTLVEAFQDNRKIYCWSKCHDEAGNPVPLPPEAEPEACVYEGFKYSYLQPSQVYFQ